MNGADDPRLDNLRPKDFSFAKNTLEKQQRIAAEGGKASGIAKREKKMFENAVKSLLAQKDPKSKKGQTNLETAVAAVMLKAQRGDVKAFESLRDTAGEKPAQAVEVSTPDGGVDVGVFADMTPEERKAFKAKIQAKLDADKG